MISLLFSMIKSSRSGQLLRSLTSRLSEPEDYFSGRRRTSEPPPDDVLLFGRTRADQLERVNISSAFHQRWMLILAWVGRGTVLLDRQPHRLGPGRALLVPPLHLHAYAELDDRLCWLFATFDWPGRRGMGAGLGGAKRLGQLAQDQAEILLRAWARPAGDGLDTAVALQRLLRVLYPPVAPLAAGDEPASAQLIERVRRAEAELPPGASVPEVARWCGLSESHLRARFRAVAGLSLGRYLREARLRRAAARLRAGAVDVKGAAEQAGFADIYTFSRAFKRALGVPPSRIRASPHISP